MAGETPRSTSGANAAASSRSTVDEPGLRCRPGRLGSLPSSSLSLSSRSREARGDGHAGREEHAPRTAAAGTALPPSAHASAELFESLAILWILRRPPRCGDHALALRTPR